jgi:YidC/Oxa1 family membrane protein insertase
MWESIIVNPMTNILLIIYKVVGENFGIAIILFTILIRVVTHPLMAKQIKGTQAMSAMQNNKEWQDIQKKHKGDKEKLAQEQMRLYKELGINPFSSCLPTIIQMPIIFGLYQSIVRALAASPGQLLILTGGVWSFWGLEKLIPVNSKFLWMNLGQPERIYVAGIAIPLLAILVALTTYVQSKVTMPPPTSPNDQGAAMNKMMSLYMPLLLGYFAYNYASGLAVYFIVSNLAGLVQYALLGKVNWKALIPGKKPIPSSASRSK